MSDAKKKRDFWSTIIAPLYNGGAPIPPQQRRFIQNYIIFLKEYGIVIEEEYYVVNGKKNVSYRISFLEELTGDFMDNIKKRIGDFRNN